MAKHPAISIVIPVYNVEKWLARAVATLQDQTFHDFELLLVDDGSTDSSGAICDQLAEADSRIVVIHQENAGAAGARNTAIARAQGDFLYFMDGDDWCEPTMLEDMYSVAVVYELDLVIAGFYIDTYYKDDKFYRELRTAPDIAYESQAEFRRHAHELFDAQLLYAPWNKLYRRSYLAGHGILFPKTFWDDLPFNLDVIRDISRVGCINARYYHFLRARAEAENTRYRANMYEKREEEHEWLQELYRYWDLDTPQIREFLSRRYSERLIGCIENVANPSCEMTREEKIAEVKRMISAPHAVQAIQQTRPNSAMMRVMLEPLKAGNAEVSLAEGEFISFVRRHNTNLFARLKANR